MAYQILLNVLLACCWMFLNDNYSGASFFSGYALGVLCLLFMRRFFPERLYFVKVWAIVKLLLIFTREVILANISVLKTILSPKLNIRPGIFAFRTDLTSDWEITVLSSMITLTPGTLVIDISDDRTILYVHAMDIDDAEKAIHDIRESFEEAIMEVSR